MNEVCWVPQSSTPAEQVFNSTSSHGLCKLHLCDALWHDVTEYGSCTEGFGPDPDSAPGVVSTYKEQYTCMHYALLAHAAAVDEFRLGGYKGKIGIKIDGGVSLPLDPTSAADQQAAARTMDFVSDTVQ